MKEEASKYHDKVIENIRDYGYHVTYVLADELPSFCYSTGLYETYSIPELFISSLPQNLSFELVRNYAALFRNNKAIPLNRRIDNLTDRFPVYLIEVPVQNLDNYVLASVRFYGVEDYEYLQLIFPDTEGHFPNDKGYSYDQDIMGSFTN